MKGFQIRRHGGLREAKALMHTWKRFFGTLVHNFLAHGCQKSAAALTYMSLFALVPLMTVVYSVFSMIPAFEGFGERLQAIIFSHFIPETGQEIQTYIADFSAQARSLTGFGVGMLVVTAYLMLTNIEKTLNDIWGVGRARSGLSSFFLYWAVLTIGPLLLGAGMAISTYLLSLRLVFDEYNTLGFSALLFRILPWLLTSLAFTLLFTAVPNCRVPIRHAVIGGGVTALVFELLKDGFSAIVANSSFQLVYGAFAVVPLFLLWLNLLWITILAGAVLVRTLSERHYVAADGKAIDTVFALKCLALFRARYVTGDSVSDHECYRLGLGVVHWQQLRNQLERNHWITVTTGGRYVLCRDLGSVSMWDLAAIVKMEIHDLEGKVANPPKAPWFEAYLEKRRRVLRCTDELMSASVESVLNPEGETDVVIADENTTDVEVIPKKPKSKSKDE